MRWSIRLGTIAGIRIEVHVTFLLLLAGVSLLGASGPRRRSTSRSTWCCCSCAS